MGGSYGECTYEEITENIEKISQNNNALSSRKSDTGINTFAAQHTHNPATDEILEEMGQMRINLWMVSNHVTGVQRKCMH